MNVKWKGIELFVGAMASLASYEVWTNIVMSLSLALVGGALGYLGKHLMKKFIERKKPKE